MGPPGSAIRPGRRTWRDISRLTARPTLRIEGLLALLILLISGPVLRIDGYPGTLTTQGLRRHAAVFSSV